jgi:hypothetical protein
MSSTQNAPTALAPRDEEATAQAERRSVRRLPNDAVVTAVLLVAIVALGAWLRFTNVNWDSGAHLHPDERYLTMVANDTRFPGSLGEYFDVERSPLSPYNVPVGQSHLYGQLPLTATKLVAETVSRHDYEHLNLVGRGLSAFLDTVSIVLVFLIAKLLLGFAGRRRAAAGALLAACLYALSVTAIQHAHFFTMESWLVFFTLLAFYLAAVAAQRPLTARTVGSAALLVGIGAAVGLAMASKLSGGLVALPVALALVLRSAHGLSFSRRAAWFAASLLTVAVSAYVAFRFTSPYAFQHSSWLDPEPNAKFRAALEQQERATSGEFLYPPQYQWLLSDPLVDPLRNLVVWALGVPLGAAAVAGIATLLVHALRRLRRAKPPAVAAMLLLFVAVVFAYFGSRFVHPVRYVLPIVPFLAAAAAFAIVVLERRSAVAGRLVAVVLVAATLAWALAFGQIYRSPNTRVAAADWISRAAPPGAAILYEDWDDGLPVSVPPEVYKTRALTVYDGDDPAKLRKLFEGLSWADYYVLSSPRAWRSIGRLPDRFPIMARFYRLLREEEVGFHKAAEFTSYPRLLGVEISDLGAEEPFWVYDHPPVLIFRRTGTLTWSRFRERLCSGPARLPGCAATSDALAASRTR